MPLPFSLVVKYRSKICPQVLGRNADAGVLDVDLDAAARRGAAARCAACRRRASPGSALSARFSSACRSIPGIGVDLRQVRRALDLHRHARALRLRRDRRRDVGDERRELDRLQLQLVGPRELQEAVDAPRRAAGSRCAMMSTCLVTSGGARGRDPRRVRPAPATGATQLTRELLLQQLEVNRHRVERVLHLVRDAGHQPPERRELARVVQRRVHLAQVAEVARDEHRAEEPAARVLDRVASSAGARSARVPPIGSRPRTGRVGHRDRDGALRFPAGERALDDLPDRVVRRRRSEIERRRLQRACIAGLQKISSPRGENSATASSRLSMTDSKSVGPPGRASGVPARIRGPSPTAAR